MFFILVDAYSKWVEVKAVKNATSALTIEQFRSIFVIHGLPELLVTDNRATFTSSKCKEFLASNEIQHIMSAPYHSSTNGQAKRSVQTVKEFLKKPSPEPLEAPLSPFLFRYRITPNMDFHPQSC
jgi:transposase InsO family protein